MARLSWIVYDVLVTVIVWLALAPAALFLRIAGRSTTRELLERLALTLRQAQGHPERSRGVSEVEGPSGTRIIVHAVSGGEMTAAGAFVAALREARPCWRVVLSCGTRDGRARAEQLRQEFDSIEAICFLPWDRARALRRWLRRLRPAAVVVVEPEFWPNLYRACGRLGIPLAVVNARVYPSDVARYRLVRSFMHEALAVPFTFAARAPADVEMLAEIGVPRRRIIVTGDLKVDAAARSSPPGAGPGVVTGGAGRPMMVAGSTHAPEEDHLLDMLARVRGSHPTLRLALAPRDVRRASRIAAACARRGYRIARISKAVDWEWDVLIVDRFGMLAPLYRAADVAFVGGTLAPRGGHTVLEAAMAGCAIIVGPHAGHVRHHVEPLEAAGGVVRLTAADELTATVERLLTDARARLHLGRNARDYVLQHLGAAERCAELVLSAVEGAPLSEDGRWRATAGTWPHDASEAPSPAAGVALRRDVECS